MSAAEHWDVVTTAADDIPAVDHHHARAIAEKLRKKWSLTDSLVVDWKSGPNWVQTEMGIAVPEDRKSVTPEGGALRIVAMAREYSEKHQHRRRIRVNVLGRSQTGDTTKTLFVHQLDFTDPEDTETADEPRTVADKANTELAVNEAMLRGMTDAFDHWKDAMGFVETMAGKVVELAEAGTKNQAGLVEALRLDYQDKREQRQAEQDARREEASDRRTDAIFDRGVDVAGSLFEEFMRKKMGLGADVLDGSYSSRLDAILKKIPAEKAATLEEVLGDDVARLLRDASQGVSDDAFRELMRQMLEKLPRGKEQQQALFMKLALALGNKELVMALGKLLMEAQG